MKYDIDSIKKRKKTNNRVKKIIFIFIIILLYNITLLYMSYINKFETPSFYIYEAYLISTESMEPELKIDDAVIIKKCKEDDLKINDIITFKTNTEVITHRIVDIIETNEGKLYATKGDNNNLEDSERIKFSQIEGEMILKIPYLGKIINVLKNGMVIVLVVLIILVIYLNKIDMKEKSEVRREKKKIEDKKFIEK